jgi:hypothetical protein
MFTPISDPTNPQYMPQVVFDCNTGADCDTLLTLIDGWSVYLHLHNDDGVERQGWVEHRGGDNVVLRHHETDQVVHVVPLADVKYIQIS